jgi:hypothetical protein
MSLFGKLLAILNVFAVLGALALMTMNYAKRESWEYAVFRQDLMIHGLPLDKEEKDEQQQPVVEKISAGTQKDLFKQAAPTDAVATQVDEVDRVKSQLSGQIQAVADKKKKLALLARVLTPMAATNEQRQRLLAYQTHLRDDATFKTLHDRLDAADKAAQKAVKEKPGKPYEEAFHEALATQFSDPLGPLGEEFLTVRKAALAGPIDAALEQSLDTQLAQLDAQFNQMFSDAKSGGEGIKGGAPSQRKRAIARLLFNMVEVLPAAPGGGDAKPDLVSNPRYKRFMFVVGVKAALEAVHEQAAILKELAFDVDVERLRERGTFADQHRKAVDVVLDKKAQVDRDKALYALEKMEADAHEVTLEDRKRDVKIYQDQLAAARRAATQHLKRLRELSNNLFDERVKLQQNSEENQQLEKQIRALEEGR